MKSFRLFYSILLVISLSLSLSLSVTAQQFDRKYFQDNPEIYFTFNVSDKIELKQITNIISIDNVSRHKSFCVCE